MEGNQLIDASEVEELSRLDAAVMAREKALWKKMRDVLQPGRKVLFRPGRKVPGRVQQGEIVRISDSWWSTDVYVRTPKTLKERRISLYWILLAYRKIVSWEDIVVCSNTKLEIIQRSCAFCAGGWKNANTQCDYCKGTGIVVHACCYKHEVEADQNPVESGAVDTDAVEPQGCE